MTVIYLDVMFLLNLIVDYLLLLAAARLAGEPFSRLRMAGGALLGASYAVSIFVPAISWMEHPVCRVCVGTAMALAAYGTSRRLLRLTLLFFALSAGLGGFVLAFRLLGTGGITLENGVLYTGFDLRLLLVTVILFYAALRLLFGAAARHGGQRRDLCQAVIMLCGKCIPVTVLLDSGNTLTEPIRNLPVLVVEARVLQSILPSGIDPGNPIGSMEQIEDRFWKGRFSLLPYRAVGVEYGMLLCVRSDRVILNGREWNGLPIALSPTSVSSGEGYQGLFGA